MLRILIASVLLTSTAQAENLLSCDDLPDLTRRYLAVHVTQPTLDRAFADRVAQLYLEGLDPSKVLLLEVEAKALHERVAAFVLGLGQAKPNCGVLDQIAKDEITWQKALEVDVAGQLGDKAFALDTELEFTVDADKRPRPKDGAERSAARHVLLHFQLANSVAAGTKLDEARTKLIKRYSLISKRLEEQKPADIYTRFMSAVANALDPHTTYFSADALEDFRIGMQLSLEGIGAVLRSRDGYTEVHEIVPGGAADRNGKLKTKDKIVAVAEGAEGEPVDVIDMSLRDVVRLIRGKKDTFVKLSVLRQEGKGRSLQIVIQRDKIDLKEQAAKLTWHDIPRPSGKGTFHLARLDLPSFYGGQGPAARRATEDVQRLLAEVTAKGADGLLFDLSRNSGGLLDAAVEITGYFIRKGPVVGVDGPRWQALDDEDPAIQYKGPLVVLTSPLSASASEIVAGAVRDYRRGVLVGDTHTFGKGTVQNILNLDPGLGALKVTMALFFRPGGESTQGGGVTVDVQVPSAFDPDEFGERSQKFSLPGRKRPAFLGDEVNAKTADARWTPVDPAIIPKLQKLSTERVAKSKAFEEVRERRAKNAKNRDVIKVADMLADPDAKKDEDDEEEDDDKLSPQAEEALHVLADLITG